MERLLLLDDDLRFTKAGLLQELEECITKNKINHVGGFWTDHTGNIDCEKTSVGNNPWFKQFPKVGEGAHNLIYCMGCQGVMNLYTRKAVEQIGYWDHMPGKYAFEHALYSMRINKEVEYRYPEWFPIYSRCNKYFIGQNVPNNYSDHEEGIRLNSPVYERIKNEIYNGVSPRVRTSGLDLSNELILGA